MVCHRYTGHLYKRCAGYRVGQANSLHLWGAPSVPSFQDTMTRYNIQSLTKSISTMVREFYISYAATIHSTIPKGKKPLAHPRLTETRVSSRQVDTSEITIRRMLFRPEFPAPRSTGESNYRVWQMRYLMVMGDLDCRDISMRWMANLIAEHVPEPA